MTSLMDVTNLSELVLEGGLGIGTQVSATFGTSTSVLVSGGTMSSPMRWVEASSIVNAGSGSTSWSVAGNTGLSSASNFLGTTDAHDVVVKVNNTQVLALGSTDGQASINLLPTADLSYNLGSSSARWSGVYISDPSIYGIVTLASTSSITGNLNVTGSASLSSHVAVAGSASLNTSLLVGSNAAITGTLGVTGLTSLGSLAVSAGVTIGSNASITGTLGVTGGTSLGSLAVASGLTVGSNATITGTLGVTGLSTLGALSAAATTLGSCAVTSGLSIGSNATITGTLGAGSTTLGSLAVTSGLSVGSNTTLTGTTTHVGAATFSSTVSVTGLTSLGSCAIAAGATIGSNATIAGTLGVTGAATFAGALSGSTSLTIAGSASLNTSLLVGSNTTMTGTLGVGGVVDAFGIIVAGATNPLAGTTQTAFRTTMLMSSAATATGAGFAVAGAFGTAAASFTCGALYGFRCSAAFTPGSGSTITRGIAYGGSTPTGATNNAFLSDNATFSGNWFINQSGTEASTLGGALTVNQTLTGNSNATITGQLLLKDGDVSSPSLAFGSSSTNSGLYRKATDSLGFVADGVDVGSFSATGAWTIGASGSTEIHIIQGSRVKLKGASSSTQCVIARDTGDGSLSITGAAGAGGGGELVLYSHTHATKLDKTEFYNDGGLSGSITNLGAWTIGSGTQAHTISGTATITGALTAGVASTSVHVLNTATTTGATNGTITQATLVAGYITININGTQRKIPFYAN